MDWKEKVHELEDYYDCVYGTDTQRISYEDFIAFLNKQKNIEILKSMFHQKTDSKYKVHGDLHALKVMVYSFYLSKKMDCTEAETQLLLYAAKYHDVGRSDDAEDLAHGYSGARWLEAYMLEFTDTEKNSVCFLVESHACPDEMMEIIAEKWQIKDLKRGIRLAQILKDADALDRYRLHMRALNPRFLRCVEARNIMRAAFVFHHYVLKCWLQKNSPKVLYHTTFSDKINNLVPSMNWDMYGEYQGEWVFATEHRQVAMLYFLHGENMGIYSFSWQNERFALVSSAQTVQKILQKNSIWMYQIPSEQFEPVISKGGEFNGEWTSSKEVNLKVGCKCERIEWSDIQGQHIHILYSNKEKNFEVYRKLLSKIPNNKQRKDVLDYCLYRGYLREYTGGEI